MFHYDHKLRTYIIKYYNSHDDDDDDVTQSCPTLGDSMSQVFPRLLIFHSPITKLQMLGFPLLLAQHLEEAKS